MTRQYKAMQEQLIEHVNKLENQNAGCEIIGARIFIVFPFFHLSISSSLLLTCVLELSRVAYEELRRERRAHSHSRTLKRRTAPEDGGNEPRVR